MGSQDFIKVENVLVKEENALGWLGTRNSNKFLKQS